MPTEEYLQRQITAILEWADETDRDFDTTFIESLEEQLDANGYLSEKQIDALANIIDRFHIEV